MRYDIAVIGNDEAAFEMLCVAATSGQRAVAVLPEQRHSSWMVSQALRRLVSQLLVDHTRSRRRLFSRTGSPSLLRRLIASALTAETQEHVTLLETLGVDVLLGEARFEDRNRIVVGSGTVCRRTAIETHNTVIGTGIRRTAMHRPLGLVPFHRPESLLAGSQLPENLCILGGDSFGAGIAALFSLFGVEARLLVPGDDSSAMLELAREAGVIVGCQPEEPGFGEGNLFSGSNADVVDCRCLVGFTDHLGLSGIGIEPDEHGQLWCAGNLETWCSGVFGIGEAVGFSSDISIHPTDQAYRILNRITHRIRQPHFLRHRAGVFASV